MSPESLQAALIGPYPLIEEEALCWSILLFDQAVLLHPFPLPLPPAYQSLIDRGLLQVRTLKRTQEEIRIKDRSLREFQAFILSKQDVSFLKYLKEVNVLETQETQEEIVGLLKGKPFKKTPSDSSIFNGHILLCLIHQWLMQDWETDASLARIEEQEKILAQGWQEDQEEGLDWEPPSLMISKRIEEEIRCPLALTAWWELKNQLVPESLSLLTTQQWVWEDHYGLDLEESRVVSIPLPDLSSLSSATWQKHSQEFVLKEIGPIIQKNMKRLLHCFDFHSQESSAVDFLKSLSALGWPSKGEYRLILPPLQPSEEEKSVQLDQKGLGPLILVCRGTPGTL
jgi:hypothetical protein